MKKFLTFLVIFIFFIANCAANEIQDALENKKVAPPETSNISTEPIVMETESKTLFSEIEKNTEKDTLYDESKTLKATFFKDVEFGAAFISQNSFEQKTNESSTHYKFKLPVADMWTILHFDDERNTNMKFMINPSRYTEDYDYIPGILSDIYVSTTPFKNNRLLIGQSRTPIGKEGGQGQYTLLFANRSQIARNFGNVRATGVKLTGDYRWVDYNIGVYDSARYLHNLFKGQEFTGWLDFKPLAFAQKEKYGTLKVGGGINTGKHLNSYTVAGAAALYEYKKFLINCEYSNANGYHGNSHSITDNSAEGFYGTIGYYVHPKVQLVGRYDCFDPNKHNNNDKIEEYSVGLNYYIKGQKIKMALNYIFRNAQNTSDSNRFIFLTQFLI